MVQRSVPLVAALAAGAVAACGGLPASAPDASIDSARFAEVDASGAPLLDASELSDSFSVTVTPDAPDGVAAPDARGDADGDGIGDSHDNCPALANAAQGDRDADGVGDLCDPCPAVAGDGGIPRVTTSFVDMSECSGFTPIHVGRSLDLRMTGQAFADYDRDGWLDLYVTNADGPNSLYRNRGDGSFEISTLSSTVALDDRTSDGATFADYDNDGWPDLYVVNAGANALFHNEAGAAFVDVTAHAGVGDVGTGMTASWGDYDEDGYLDLYVANYDPYDPALSEDRLFHNDGDGTFRDVTALLDPACVTGFGFMATFTDVDEDGDLDLYVVNDKGSEGPTTPERTNRNVLFRNEGRGCGEWCFVEVAEAWGADMRIEGMGVASFDLDVDGDIDHLVTNTYPPVLLRNEHPLPRFTEVATEVGLDRGAMWPATWGTVAFDYDRDSLVDLYLGGWGPDFLFAGTARGVFVDRTAFSGVSNDRNTTGAASADYDRDGRVDLLIGNFAWDYRLLRNRTSLEGRHGVTVRLVGGGPVDRDAIGSRVWLETAGVPSRVCEVVDGSGLGGGSDLACHFGVGADHPDAVVVRWLDGTTQRVARPAWDVETLVRYGM